MQLIHDRAEGYFFIRAISHQVARVIDRDLHTSFVICVDRVVENWTPTRVEEIDDEAMQIIANLQPELVILGTGERQQFPRPSLLATLLRSGIGVEVMDNRAAARTYNLLAAEGRRAVAAFLLSAVDSA
ncbi:MAG: MTH938/NDUFAF3 family protein [Dokdonella sp.]|jgi:uncharacterized protein|uniref:Mth938-like domain-containing protein n=1 Tax=Dokdonella sp. TaxID=2291710 RepID=UPI002B7B5F49|nr:MTH938/NDUFAF3 family protein [Dokdonella sp.]HNV08700.1 MTH938/NDUFAF3 family protein [Dokdonella sp.]HPW04558.1 MTH938/NDUFAF3 family protein [Dokdonella sp.]